MRLIFAGTPNFAAAILQALLDAHHDIAAVLTQPDKPAKRGLLLQQSPVKEVAKKEGLTILQPGHLRDDNLRQTILKLNADALIVAAYGLILPESILHTTPLGAMNVHASLLPRWRGAAPIQRAILAGDDHTGVSIMQMEKGLDTGPVLLQKKLAIVKDDTSESLGKKLADLGAATLLEVLHAQAEGRPFEAAPQNNAMASYAHKINKEEALIDWHQPALVTERIIRAFYPDPAARTVFLDIPVRIFKAEIEKNAQGMPGAILDINEKGILVACGQQGLWLQELQRAGGKKMLAKEWAKGVRLPEKAHFGR